MTTVRLTELIQCSRCFGRGYQPEYPKLNRTYLRVCPGCRGQGQRPPTVRDRAQQRREETKQ